MSQVILLDSAPVGLITNPKVTPLAVQCQQWFLSLSQRGYQVILPEIIDYEIRALQKAFPDSREKVTQILY
ncbi:hypothetical protein [Planktothrix agardhii]|jgi:hypothetical protein|uniref:hypothetical protein n=1 Tax=Planktothrix agardhii TaxID=1160 RepID=UPI000DBB0DF5|nr:hypothetical protein [Planktothrix agardhii]MCB8749276.1 hypothetical protein [Planktothrix agardhii 1810]MCF3605301.1 hypothetical protein [Planktothrix agardhii 1033]BBD54014.1 hypothetical protein NIES204_12980 [Planktothrix agardhii NIES-204]